MLDGRSLLRLALPGLSCDAFSEIAFWHLRRHRDQAWIFAFIGLQTEVVVSAALVSQMQTEISHIPWADSPAATAAVWSAYMTMGSPPATLLLAQACDDHGLNSLGSELRTRVQKFQKNFQALAIHGEFVHYFRDMIDEICLVTSCPWGDSIADAIAAGERFQKRYPADKQWDSICLYLAHAHLTAGHPDPAVDALIDSFIAPQIDPAPSYFTAKDGQIATTRAFRTWLVKKLLPMPGFGDAQRKRLIAATQADLVDEEFAKILGVAPGAFGKKSAVGANDF